MFYKINVYIDGKISNQLANDTNDSMAVILTRINFNESIEFHSVRLYDEFGVQLVNGVYNKDPLSFGIIDKNPIFEMYFQRGKKYMLFVSEFTESLYIIHLDFSKEIYKVGFHKFNTWLQSIKNKIKLPIQIDDRIILDIENLDDDPGDHFVTIQTK